MIEEILESNYLDRIGVTGYEELRIKLRDLIKFIPDGLKVHYDTNFMDDLLAMEWRESELDNDDLVQYKKEGQLLYSAKSKAACDCKTQE